VDVMQDALPLLSFLEGYVQDSDDLIVVVFECLPDIAPAIWLVTGTEYAASGDDVSGIELTSRGIPYELVSLSKE